MVIGILLMIFGCVWFLQGINVIHQGFMAGQPKWEINGIIAFVVGLLLVVYANQKRKTG